MLKHVDVFLGVALVMLGVSLLITIVTQMVSFLANLRGRELRKGLGELIETLSQRGKDALPPGVARELAGKILCHPLVRDGLGAIRLTPAIARADLLRLLRAGYLDVDKKLTDKLAALAGGIDDWFDTAMSRISNRFHFRMRLVTVAAAAIAAFALQLDAFALVKRLYADADLRAALAGATATMMSRAEEVLAQPAQYRSAAVELAQAHPGELTAPSGNIANRELAQDWLMTAVPDPQRAGVLLVEYDSRLRQAIQKSVPGLFDKAAGIKRDLELAGFTLLPRSPYRPWKFGSPWTLLGILASTALLSLGAPFWFNALKTASNLRPALARQVDAREQADDSAGPAGPSSGGPNAGNGKPPRAAAEPPPPATTIEAVVQGP